MIYIKLFWSFFQVGLFSVGGGYAAIPLIQDKVVMLNHWLTMSEFTDIITIAQMAPGSIAINSATFIGIQVAGIGGGIIATLGCILPSSIIVLTIAYFYFKYKKLDILQGILRGLRPAVVSLIASAAISIMFLSFFGEKKLPTNIDHINFVSIGIFIISLTILRKFKANPIHIMLASGFAGIIIYSFL